MIEFFVENIRSFPDIQVIYRIGEEFFQFLSVPIEVRRIQQIRAQIYVVFQIEEFSSLSKDLIAI